MLALALVLVLSLALVLALVLVLVLVLVLMLMALALALALAQARPASPEASAAEPGEPGSPAMAGELQRHFDGMLERDGMREYAEEHPAPLLADGRLDPRFRVHKRSPFGSGNDHTVGGLDCEMLPAVKPQRCIPPHTQRRRQSVG